MSLASQARSLAEKGAQIRREIYGDLLLINGVPVIGAWGAISNKKTLQMGGFDPETSAVCRVHESVLVYAENIVTRAGAGYYVDEVIVQPHSPEKVIKLRAK